MWSSAILQRSSYLKDKQESTVPDQSSIRGKRERPCKSSEPPEGRNNEAKAANESVLLERQRAVQRLDSGSLLKHRVSEEGKTTNESTLPT